MQKLLLLVLAFLLVAPLLAHKHKGGHHNQPEDSQPADPSTESSNNDDTSNDDKGDDDDSNNGKGDDDDKWKGHHKGKWGYHKHHNGKSSSCHFQNDKSTFDLRLLMRDMNGKDWELIDESTKTTFLFNPCKPVTDDRCPTNSALCAVEDTTAVSFGMADQKQWTEVENGVEISYAGGSDCSNGVPRKTVMQLLCSQPSMDQTTHKTVLTEFKSEECMVTASITSPYGCPVEQLCSVYGQPECEASEGLCNWKEGKCAHSASNCVKFGRHHLSFAAIFGIVGSISALALCGLSACLCMCFVRRRRILRQRRQTALPVAKKAKSVETEEQLEMPQMSSIVYQPMQQMGVPFPQIYNPMVFQTREGVVQFMPTSIQNE